MYTSLTTNRGADCWSDNQYVHSKVHIQLARDNQMTRKKPHRSLNLSRLCTDSAALHVKVKEMIVSTDIVVMDPGNGCRAFMESTYDVAAETLQFVKHNHRDWFEGNDAEISEFINTAT